MTVNHNLENNAENSIISGGRISTIFIAFVFFVIGITIGLGFDSMSQFDDVDSLANEIERSRNEYNYFQEGAARCDACLVDALGALPENWCSDGTVVKTQPFYDSDKNCYCPSPPECIKTGL